MNHTTHLEAVTAAADRVDEAKATLRATLAHAVEAGVPRIQLAPAARISRPTLWKWLGEEQARTESKLVGEPER